MSFMANEISPEIRAYMSALGSKKTEAKMKSARENLAKGANARRKDPMTLPCVCGQCPDKPLTTCPRGRLLRQRARLSELAATSS